MNTKRWQLLAPWVTALAVLMLFSEGDAQAPTVEDRIAALELRMTTLEAKVATLDSGEGNAGVATPDTWKNLTLWRTELQRGLTKTEVKRVLGEPDKVIEYPGGSTWWHYGYPSGGYVAFDSRGRLESWSEP